MKLWATKQADGSYMLTALRPQLHRVGRSERLDWYVRAGEPVGLRHLCAAGFEGLTGIHLEPLGKTRVEVTAKEIAEE